MKTIESTLSQLTNLSIVEDLQKVLREKDREFLPVEAKFQEAVSDLAIRIGKTAAEELMTAWDRQICSDLVYAGYLGFQANLHNFHNPVASQFTRLDYETFLREHIMQTMPYRNEAEAAATAIQEAYEEALNEYEDAQNPDHCSHKGECRCNPWCLWLRCIPESSWCRCIGNAAGDRRVPLPLPRY